MFSEEEYDELDWRAEDQYWLTDTKLVVEESTNFSSFPTPNPDNPDNPRQQAIHVARSNKIAISKLQR